MSVLSVATYLDDQSSLTDLWFDFFAVVVITIMALGRFALIISQNHLCAFSMHDTDVLQFGDIIVFRSKMEMS
jgi:hypothetical protein